MQDQRTPAPPAGGGLWGEHGRRVQFLRRVGVFQDASPEMLTHVATALRPLQVAAGAVVCREGEPGDQFFLIEAGTLLVVTEVAGQQRALARLGPGEFFGEIALLGGGRRTATVRAETEAQLWFLSAEDFRELLERGPGIAAILRRAMQIRQGQTARGVFEVERRNLAALASKRDQISIGRGAENDLVFSSRLVSRHHAVVERVGETWRLRDLGAVNGTFVNGAQVSSAELRDGDEVWIGNERFIFDRREIHQLTEPRGIRIDVTGLSKALKGGKTLLHDISLSVLPGELVAIVGGSGAGKTTLMDAISGVRPGTGGIVRYNGRDYYHNLALYRNVLGYVPQDDIIHTELPTRRTLWHAARLRLPPDSSTADLNAAVDGALASLGLTGQANVRVEALSGGQRKRCSIGVELLTHPRVFFLDEPTSGLDPATDAQMMRLLRKLADEGSSVLLTTHATKNVALCDKLVVLARGGHLAFVGTPGRALRYFGVEAVDEIYDLLADQGTPEEWAQRFRESEDYRQVLVDQPRADQPPPAAAERQALGATGRPGGPLRQLRQFAVLSRRGFDIWAKNPANLPSLIMPPVIFTLLMLALFKNGAFELDTDNPSGALQLLFLITFSVFIFGLLFAVQEIVKEFPIFRRERQVNLAIVPYVLSKLSFLAPLLVGLLVFMLVVLRVAGRLPSVGFDVYGKLLLTMVLTGFAGLAIALFTSALVSTSQQATDMLSLWIMPQVLFAGALLAVPAMNAVGRFISSISVARWSFEALGRITDLDNLFANGTSPIGQTLALQYEDSFSRDPVQNWLILVAFILVPMTATCLILRAKSTSR